MGFSKKPSDCRVDVFKPSGKWYDTIMLDMEGEGYDTLPTHDHFIACMKNQYPQWMDRAEGEPWMIVCLDPYHKHSHPIMIKL